MLVVSGMTPVHGREGRAYDESRIREIPCQPFHTSILHSQRRIKVAKAAMEEKPYSSN